MDWMIDGDDVAAVPALREQVMAYLRRHASPDSDLGGAELVVSELLTNAVLHAGGPVWVAVDWSLERPEVRVADVGPGFELEVRIPAPDSIGGRGLFIAAKVAEQLEAHRRSSGGSVVTAVLPVERAASTTIDPPRRRAGALPRLDEARPDGGFGRETFLRALVVQLALAVAEQQGPLAAEHAVAQVGADIGGQMEHEFRLAAGVTGRLTPEQMAACYVRLKHAIEGGFSVVEAGPERIVLENDCCPFGDVVQRAPSLCRMTSSVFGGIAARNTDRGADVVLEERIAVGDPGCRVVIELEPATPSPKRWAHRYLPPSSG